MKPADISRVPIPGAPSLRPDGRKAVVAVRRADLEADDYTSQLWLVDTDGSGQPRQLTHGWRDGSPRWSPDGAWIAFTRSERADDGATGKPQVWVLPTDGGEPHRLTDHPLGAADPMWSPDSTRLAYVARVPEGGRYGSQEGVGPEKEAPRRITRFRYRLDNLGFLDSRPQHVWLVDLAGTTEQVTHGDADHGDVDWSPSGDLLAFSAARHETAGDDMRSDIWVCAPDGSGLRALTAGGLAADQPRFSADGTLVCFAGIEIGEHGRQAVAKNDSLWAVPVAGGEPVRLTDEERHHQSRAVRMVTTADGVLFPNEHRGAGQLLLVPYAGGEPRVVLDGRRQVNGLDQAGGTLVATIADENSWGELVTGSGTVLTNFSEEFRATAGIRPQVEIEAVAPDGYPVHGWVVRPDGPGPHPVLLMIHGGPFTQYAWGLFDEAQVYASAGYAVVMGNPRGSSGYGQAHGRAILGNVGEASATDLLALLDAALADPSLDGQRVGVLGGSHGGFMTTWMAGNHGDRFKAAVSERAVNAIDSFTGSSDIGWAFADDLYGPDPDRQRAQSPLTYADRIEMPVLIIHSEQDWRCPVEQGQRLFVTLRRRGVPAEFLLFPGEGHEMSRSGLPSHRVARFEAILDWWSRHL
ncbi:S9 family peptidase [Rugosimonospora africana]|uniref:S9 family peptidase n=1 Tax=Rugosimonospora africana TaxID=556532 RepID=UPI0019442BFA|nr:S9 family peptidase [Rugosimonospora africana]